MSQNEPAAVTDSKSPPPPADPTPELRKLMELATKYPEIGPTVAELAFKLGRGDIGERVVRMGKEGEGPGLEYYFVMAHAARRERRFTDVLAAALDAARTYAETPADKLDEEDGNRMLHLLRAGFAVLLFDIQDVAGHPEYARGLTEILPRLEERLGKDAFFRTLWAQTVWFHDREQSEKEWDRALELGEDDLSWNARGTWYKDAERDLDKAERAYRQGLQTAPRSALLMHNLAQVLVDKAEAGKNDAPRAHKLLREADDHLRAALREDAPIRRHIHSTRDRLHALRRSLPAPPRKKGPAGPGGKGPRQHKVAGGGGGGGGGGGPRPPRDDRRPPPRPQQPGEKFLTEGKVGLGEMILAKLKEQESKS